MKSVATPILRQRLRGPATPDFNLIDLFLSFLPEGPTSTSTATRKAWLLVNHSIILKLTLVAALTLNLTLPLAGSAAHGTPAASTE